MARRAAWTDVDSDAHAESLAGYNATIARQEGGGGDSAWEIAAYMTATTRGGNRK